MRRWAWRARQGAGRSTPIPRLARLRPSRRVCRSTRRPPSSRLEPSSPRSPCPVRAWPLGPWPMPEPFYTPPAITYPNGKPHIGHAYEAIAADVIARFRRSQGRDVRLVTGTDEHGLKMVQTARAAGRDTLEFADEMSGYFRDMCSSLNISYDAFVRTTEPRHYESSQTIWKAMEANGDLYVDRY